MMDISGKTAIVTGAAPRIGGGGRSCSKPAIA
jgi:NAD(P)-dependent dehydrogenase (short-subunit alcohol dehydrogenase family)